MTYTLKYDYLDKPCPIACLISPPPTVDLDLLRQGLRRLCRAMRVFRAHEDMFEEKSVCQGIEYFLCIVTVIRI